MQKISHCHNFILTIRFEAGYSVTSSFIITSEATDITKTDCSSTSITVQPETDVRGASTARRATGTNGILIGIAAEVVLYLGSVRRYSTLRATEVRRLKTALWSMKGWCLGPSVVPL
jgi:hypothetical protein